MEHTIIFSLGAGGIDACCTACPSQRWLLGPSGRFVHHGELHAVPDNIREEFLATHKRTTSSEAEWRPHASSGSVGYIDNGTAKPE
jgi:hypothetical protein